MDCLKPQRMGHFKMVEFSLEEGSPPILRVLEMIDDPNVDGYELDLSQTEERELNLLELLLIRSWVNSAIEIKEKNL